MKSKKSKNRKPPTCAVTGQVGDMKKVPFKNNQGAVIGYVYLSRVVMNTIDQYEISVTVNWKKNDTPDPKPRLYSGPTLKRIN